MSLGGLIPYDFPVQPFRRDVEDERSVMLRSLMRQAQPLGQVRSSPVGVRGVDLAALGAQRGGLAAAPAAVQASTGLDAQRALADALAEEQRRRDRLRSQLSAGAMQAIGDGAGLANALLDQYLAKYGDEWLSGLGRSAEGGK